MDAVEANGAPVALSLGGNLGDVEASFRRALTKLAERGFSLEKASSLYRTAPVGCEEGAPDFWNAAATGRWKGSPQELLAVCKELEREAGRPGEHPRWHSRTLDIDIVLFGDLELSSPSLRIPHPEARLRGFVLEPLAEIAGSWAFPGDPRRSVLELLAALPKGAGFGEMKPFALNIL